MTVEFFEADSDGEEGETFLGSESYSAAGSTTFIVAAGSISDGDLLVATASNANDSTSEFSAPVTVQLPNVQPPEEPPAAPAVPVPVTSPWALAVLVLLLIVATSRSGFITTPR